MLSLTGLFPAAVGYSTSYIDPYAALRNKSGIVSQDPKESEYVLEAHSPEVNACCSHLFVPLKVAMWTVLLQLLDSSRNSSFKRVSWYSNSKQHPQSLQLAKPRER